MRLCEKATLGDFFLRNYFCYYYSHKHSHTRTLFKKVKELVSNNNNGEKKVTLIK